MKTNQQIHTNTSRNHHGRKAQFKPEATMQVVFFKPNIEFEVGKDEPSPFAAQTILPFAIFKRISQHVRETGIAMDEFLKQAIAEKIANDIDDASTNAINAAMGLGGAR